MRVMKSYYIRLCLLVIFFVVSCGGGGSSTPPTPTASLSASIQDVEVGKVTTLTWSSTNATACSATGSWSQLGLDQTLNIDGADNTLLGLSTSMSNDGTIVAFGAPALSEVETGAVLTLRYTSGNWDYFDVLTDSVPGRAEGWSSDISNDGTIIASGNYQTGDNKGRAQVGKFEIEN